MRLKYSISIQLLLKLFRGKSWNAGWCVSDYKTLHSEPEPGVSALEKQSGQWRTRDFMTKLECIPVGCIPLAC